MSDYRVNLDVFSGPLDLLLYLVRKDEVEIYDIPIANLTAEYIRYIDLMEMLDIEVAGDFVVMAAALMEIKSAMLLPADDVSALDDEETLDPRGELIRQLLEYKKFKDTANILRASSEQQGQKFARSGNILSALEPDAEPELDMEQINIWDLLGAFDTVMKATGNYMDISHITDDTPIDLYQIEVLHRLQSEGPMSFERIFEGRKNKLVMIGLFLSILELARENLITAEQAKADMPIYLRSLTDVPAEQAVEQAIYATEEQMAEQNEQKPEIPIAEIDPPAQSAAGTDSEQPELSETESQEQ